MSNPIYGHPEFLPGDPVSLAELRRLDRLAAGFENATVTGAGATGADGLQVNAPVPRPAFWARITANYAGAAYSFKEVMDDGTGLNLIAFADVQGGMTGQSPGGGATTGYALEVNGNAAVPADPDTGAIVWIVQSEANERWSFSFNGSNVPSPAPSINVRVYTAGDTWTKPAGLTFVEVQVVGGGGGGAGTPAVTNEAGSGGGAGGYSYRKVAAAGLGATEAVTVGAGGAGGAASSTGAAGGTTSFGALLSATGGAGGVSGSQFPYGGQGGLGSGGDLNCGGGVGGPGIGGVWSTGVSDFSAGGNGGNSFFGGGGMAIGDSGHTVGDQDATAPGGGGAGIHHTASTAGGNGAAGVVIVREYLHFG